MSIFGKVVKSTVGLLALGLDTVITKGAHGLEKRYGRNELVKTVSDIGSSSVWVTEKTVAIGLLALGATDTGDPDHGGGKKVGQSEDGPDGAKIPNPGSHQD
ncbi:MAG: hypothetical protein ABRQ24_11480 [Syntrophomonadaceae bacterium]